MIEIVLIEIYETIAYTPEEFKEGILTSYTDGVSQLGWLVLGRDLAEVISSVSRLSQRDDQRVAIFGLF